jgi:flagellar basal body rod protein FlgB
MSLFNSTLSKLMDQRIQWMSKKHQVLADNVMRSDVPGSRRTELKDFAKIVKERNHILSQDSTNGNFLDDLKLRSSDVRQTNSGILREHEMVELSKNMSEYKAYIELQKQLFRLFKIASSKVV